MSWRCQVLQQQIFLPRSVLAGCSEVGWEGVSAALAVADGGCGLVFGAPVVLGEVALIAVVGGQAGELPAARPRRPARVGSSDRCSWGPGACGILPVGASSVRAAGKSALAVVSPSGRA